MLASCWVAANELAASEARESVSGWYESEAVVMGWPDVLMRARKLEPETSLSFSRRSSQRSSCRSLMTSPLRRATHAPPGRGRRRPCTPAACEVYTRHEPLLQEPASRLRSYLQDGDAHPMTEGSTL